MACRVLSHSSPPIAGPVPGRRWADSKGLPVQVPDTNPSPPVWPQPPGPPLSTSPCPRCPSSSLRPTGALGTLFLVTPYPTHSSLTWWPPASYQTDSCLPPDLLSLPHTHVKLPPCQTSGCHLGSSLESPKEPRKVPVPHPRPITATSPGRARQQRVSSCASGQWGQPSVSGHRPSHGFGYKWAHLTSSWEP